MCPYREEQIEAPGALCRPGWEQIPGGSVFEEGGDLSLQTPTLILTHWKTVPKPILASSLLYSLSSPWHHKSNARRLGKRKKRQINEKRGNF